MITIHVRLHGILRDKLPPEDKGRTTLSVPDGTTVAAILARFSLRRHVEVVINEEIVDNRGTHLQDGDRLEFFRAAAGGSENNLRVDQFRS